MDTRHCRSITEHLSSMIRMKFRCARRLASKLIGPRTKFYAAAPSACPTLKQWSDFLAQSGANGGMSAVPLWSGTVQYFSRFMQARTYLH
eukprot:7971228-Heterocapsa_arctica.AAC.1